MNLGIFNDMNLYTASADLFQQLGIKVNSNTSEPLPIEGLLKQHLKDTEIFKSINHTFFIGIIDDSVFQQMSLFKGDYSYSDALQQADKSYDGLMFFALELAKHPTRTEISELTRAFNRISQKMPVALILKYKFEKETALSITISERFKYKQNWRQGEKAGKVIILRDVKTINTHAGHQRILLDLVKPVGVNNYAQLHEHWLQVLDVSVLNKQFYQKLFNWYLWALTKAEFPQIRPEEDKIKNDVHQSESLIRLLSRLLFCWFMKEKGLINPNLFNIDYLRKILKGFEGIRSEETIYYKAILQNLFFATLNKPIDERKIIDKGFNKKEYGDPLVYRYEELFKDDKNILSHFENIPFLNGGLFDCLDQKKDKDNPVEIRLDGFSTKKDKQPIMPDMLFFGEYDGIDLSEEYDDKKKSKVKVFGLLDILHQYKFTIEENTPLEEEIALDPELLGKVFENLLASYNPETKATARKQTGSFYTPREIVSYMVDESLLCYLKNTVADEERLRNLFSYNETVNPFDKNETTALIEAINTAKILDPACGSGAFPMGVLQKLIHLLHKLDPENKIWFELVIANFPSAMQNVARQRLEKENWNFVRKLGIIQECIYGVDIQPIAIQISKLRFFIALLVDQADRPKEPNRGFEPLPNLDFKLIAANTLIAAPESDTVTTGLFSGQKDPFFHEFDLMTNEYFNVHLPKDKKEKKLEILKLIDIKIIQKQRQLKRAIDIKNKIQTNAGEAEIKLWYSYANMFKNEAVGFFEIKYFFPKIAFGFDIVIGNPPYGITFTSDDIAYFRKKYKVVIGHSEAYYLFIEKGITSLKENGILAYITPNAWLSNKYARGVRNWLLHNTKLNVLINLNQKFVFENAGVETSILIVSNSKASLNFNAKVGNDIEVEALYNYDYSDWLNNEFFNISFSNNPKENLIIKKVQDTNLKLSDVLDISNGFKPYQVGYGYNYSEEPLTEDDVEKKIYHSTSKKGKDYKPQLKGKNVAKYYYDFTEGYIKWGPWLMSPKDERYFENTKILIRQITGETLLATIDKEKYYADQTLYVAINYKPALISLEYCLAILNSKLLGFYFRKFYSEEDSLFPKIKVNELKSLPIKRFAKENELLLALLVNYILIKKKLSNEKNDTISLFFERLTDAVVYELYFPEEIKAANCNVLEHLTNLPELRADWDEQQNLKTIESVHNQFSNPTHPISAALLKLLNVEEVKIIEGIK